MKDPITVGLIVLSLLAIGYLMIQESDSNTKCEAAGGFMTYTNNGDSVCINKSTVIKY